MDSFLKGRADLTRKDVIDGGLSHSETEESKLAAPLDDQHGDESRTKLTLSKEVLVPEEGDDHVTLETTYEGDVLRKIIIHCDCGKEIVLDCCYVAPVGETDEK